MPTQLTIPVRPQFGVGTFEPANAFGGLSSVRWSWETVFGPIFTGLDAAFTPILGGSGQLSYPPAPGQPNIFTNVGQQALGNVGKGLTNTQHAHASHLVQQSFLFDGFATAIQRAAFVQLAAQHDVKQKTAPAKIIQYIRPVERANLRPLEKEIAAANARALKAEAEAEDLRRRVARLERASMKPHAVAEPGVIPRLGDLERWRERVDGKLRNPL